MLKITPLSPGLAFGALVEGLTPERLNQPGARASLQDLWIKAGVVVFRGDDSPQMLLELSRCFGPLEQHVLTDSLVEGHRELVQVKYFPGGGTLYEVDGRRLGGWLPWHSDLIYTSRINKGGILRSITLPPAGGRTGFIDQVAAYEALPERLRSRIENLHVVYALDFNAERQRFGRAQSVRLLEGAPSFMKAMARQYQFPRVMHPMVYRQEETGRQVLNVSPWFALGIYEMGGADGDALLEEVIAHCTQESAAYYHDWSHGDLVLWDNWRTLHCCTGVAPDAVRIMQRTTIAGDYALGRELDDRTSAGRTTARSI
jgi:taurine dioxygenase